MKLAQLIGISVICATTVAPLIVPAEAKLPIGGQNGSSNYYDATHRYFTDYAKYLGQWWWPNRDGSAKIADQDKIALLAAEKAGLLDSSGYPLEVPLTVPGFASQLYVEAVLPGFFDEGDYVLLYDGQGTIDFYLSNYVTVKSRAGGRIVLHCTPKQESAFYAVVMIKGSVRGDNVRNLRILPIAVENSYNPAQPFSKQWLDVVNHLSVYRFMGHCGTNDWVTHGKWKDRVTRTYFSQSTARGISYDLAIDMCNLLKVDPWFCIPHMVDDEYIRRFAQLVKEKLDPSLKVYIEYSNEIWNWAYAYPQAQYVIQCGRMAGMPAWDAADTIYNALKKLKDAQYGHPEMDAYMIQRTLNIWRSVFTGADRSRLICVAATQIGWADNTRRILNYLYNTNGEFTTYASTGSGCDAVAGAPYFSRTETMATWEKGPIEQTKYARQRGIKSIYYEGGSEAKQGIIAGTSLLWNSQKAVFDKYDSILTRMEMSDIACDLFVTLTVVGDIDGYAHLDSLSQIYLSPNVQPWKWQAIMKYTSRTPTQYSVGTMARPAFGAGQQPALSRTISKSVVLGGSGLRGPVMTIGGRSCANEADAGATGRNAQGLYLQLRSAGRP